MELINLSVSNFLNMCIFIYIVSKLFDTKVSMKIMILIYFTEFICLCIANSLHYIQCNAFIVLFTNTILLLLCYHGKLSLKIYITFVYVCFGMILEIFSLIFIHYLFKINYDLINLDSIYYLAGTVFSSLSLFIVLSLFSKFLTSLSITKYPKKTLLLLCLPITSVLFVSSIKNIDNLLIKSNTTIILIFIGLLISNILSFYIFFDIIKILHENTNIKLKESYRKIDELNYQLLETKYDNTRKFIHDIKKHVNTITQLISNNDYKELLLYLNELNSEIKKTDYTIQTSQKILNIIINQEINLLEKENIRIKLDVDEIDMSFLSIVEQNLLYGNLLENAIESCINCYESKIIILKLKEDEKHIILKLKNSCSNAIIVNGVPLTTKSNKEEHGFGLKKINSIIEHHNGKMINKYDFDMQIFNTSIVFPKENNHEIY